eukprot:COSAG05_NODE_1163_length_5656_cov_2.387979_7_plen_123_part_00
MNMGGYPNAPGNHSMWLELGGRGIDTALTYGTAQQHECGAAIRASGVPRSEIFLATKVPCCPGPECPGKPRRNTTADILADLSVLNLSVGFLDSYSSYSFPSVASRPLLPISLCAWCPLAPG